MACVCGCSHAHYFIGALLGRLLHLVLLQEKGTPDSGSEAYCERGRWSVYLTKEMLDGAGLCFAGLRPVKQCDLEAACGSGFRHAPCGSALHSDYCWYLVAPILPHLPAPADVEHIKSTKGYKPPNPQQFEICFGVRLNPGQRPPPFVVHIRWVGAVQRGLPCGLLWQPSCGAANRLLLGPKAPMAQPRHLHPSA